MTKETNIFHANYIILDSIRMKVNAIKKAQLKNWTRLFGM